MKRIKTKSGKIITFCQVKPSDFKAIYQWVKEIEKEDTFNLINAAEPISLKEEMQYFKDLFKKIKLKKVVKIAVFDGKKYLGSCDIEKMGKRQKHIGIFGIALSKECRGQGVGFRLAQETIKLAQKKLGIRQIALKCFANNQVGQSLYKKLGFKQYGIHPRAIQYKGKLIDEIMYYKDL